MRVRPASADACSKQAKLLKNTLDRNGQSVTLSAAQNALGRMHGYRTWHEMVLSLRRPGASSLFDEDVGDREVACRLEAQARALVECFNLDAAAAAAIVAAVRPTARTRPGGAKDPIHAANASWRGLMASARNDDGFLRFVTSGWTRPTVDPTLVTTYGDAVVTAWIQAVGKAMGDGPTAVEFTVAAHSGGALVGILSGIGAAHSSKPRRRKAVPGEDEARTDAAIDAVGDAFGNEAGDALAHAMDRANQYLCFPGCFSSDRRDGLFWVHLWERSLKANPGTGSALMRTLVSASAKAGLSCSSVVIDPSPAQFPHPVAADVRLRLDYRTARLGIENVLAFMFEESDLATGPEFICYEPALDRTGMETRTLSSEPVVMRDADWPEAYDQLWLWEPGARLKVAPHPALWAWMPSELLSITFCYEEVTFTEEEGERPFVQRLEFRFANGATLRLGWDDLAEHFRSGQVPTLMCGADGKVLDANPFTASMGIDDMLRVLSTNVGLAFGGNPGVPGRDVGRVTVCRPLN